jgi:hypothetical protein
VFLGHATTSGAATARRSGLQEYPQEDETLGTSGAAGGWACCRYTSAEAHTRCRDLYTHGTAPSTGAAAGRPAGPGVGGVTLRRMRRAETPK